MTFEPLGAELDKEGASPASPQPIERDPKNSSLRRFFNSDLVTKIVYEMALVLFALEPEALPFLDLIAGHATAGWTRWLERHQLLRENLSADDVTVMGVAGQLKVIMYDIGPPRRNQVSGFDENMYEWINRLTIAMMKIYKYLGFDYLDGRFAAIQHTQPHESIDINEGKIETNRGKLIDTLSDRIREFSDLNLLEIHLQTHLKRVYDDLSDSPNETGKERALEQIKLIHELMMLLKAAAQTVAYPSAARAYAEANGFSVIENMKGSSLSRNVAILTIAMWISHGSRDSFVKAKEKLQELKNDNETLARHRMDRANWVPMPKKGLVTNEQEGRERYLAIMRLMEYLINLQPQEIPNLADPQKLKSLLYRIADDVIKPESNSWHTQTIEVNIPFLTEGEFKEEQEKKWIEDHVVIAVDLSKVLSEEGQSQVKKNAAEACWTRLQPREASSTLAA